MNKINILILSVGRRVNLVNFFIDEFRKNNLGNVYVADMDKYAPALYCGSPYFLLEKDFSNLDKYIDDVILLCKKHDISYIITLIDPELNLLSQNKSKFLKNGITPIVSDNEMIMNTFDKYKFANFFKDDIPVIPTYFDKESLMKDLDNGLLQYPLFKKSRLGSGSSGIGKVCNENDLNLCFDNKDLIIQPCVLKKEYGVDVYFDILTGKIVSLFIKEKIKMRAGETDKSISLFRKDIVDLVSKLEKFPFKGPIDIDVFEDENGVLYVNEINPRFGGGYPHAYSANVNFIKLLINNLKGIENSVKIGAYDLNLIMMKYNGLVIKKSDVCNRGCNYEK